MNNQTLAGIAALTRTDRTVEVRELTRRLALLRQSGAPTTQKAATSPRRVIQRAETAQ